MDCFAERNIPVALINAARRRTVVSTGALAADILHMTHQHSTGQVLLLGGAYENDLLQRRSLDFSQRLNEQCKDLTLLEIHLYHDLARLDHTLKTTLPSMENLVGIFAVSARETMCMCRAVSELGLAGKLTTVGVDAFPELLPFFSDGTLTASIYHYPSRMSYLLAYRVASQLTGITFPSMTQTIPAVPVFQSSAAFFCNNDGVI